jgi:hypothetical protein
MRTPESTDYLLNCTKYGNFSSRKIVKNCCHQMSSFKAKRHKIRIQLDVKGPISERREGEGPAGKERRGENTVREGKRPPHSLCGGRRIRGSYIIGPPDVLVRPRALLTIYVPCMQQRVHGEILMG